MKKDTGGILALCFFPPSDSAAAVFIYKGLDLDLLILLVHCVFDGCSSPVLVDLFLFSSNVG